MCDSLSSVWGHLVHFANFPMLRFSKGYCCHNFRSISNFIISMLVMREYRLLLFWPSVKSYKVLWFEIFVNIGPYRAGISKCYSPYGFHLISAELHETLATKVEYSLLLSWQSAKFKNFVAV